MEDSARDGGTVILAEVIQPCFMTFNIFIFTIFYNNTNKNQASVKGLGTVTFLAGLERGLGTTTFQVQLWWQKCSATSSFE